LDPPDEPFLPALTRRARQSTKDDVAGHEPFIDNPSIVMNKIEVEDSDGDLSGQNLVIVDGGGP